MVDESCSRRTFSSSSRSKFIKKDKEGLASTVGTIMALLVFMTFLTIFTSTYIPIWMKENEKQQMDDVLTQFGDMKGKVDNLIVNAQVTGRATIDMYQTISLGSDGIPVFASATTGYLFLKPSGTYDTGVNVQFSYDYYDDVLDFDDDGGGEVEFFGPNRYYVTQWYAYENGAVMLYQKDGMVMRATPSIVFEPNDDGTVNVQFDQVDIISNNESISGEGVAGITIDLIYHDSQTYSVTDTTGTDGNGTLTLTFTTRYVDVWMDFINDTADEAGLVAGTNYVLTSTELAYDEYRPIYTVTLTINDVNEFTHNRAYVSLGLEY